MIQPSSKQSPITHLLAAREAMRAAIRSNVARIGTAWAPSTHSEHLIALFMSVVEFYDSDALPIPPDLVTLLNDMQRVAHQTGGAHALELMRAVDVFSHRPALRNDANVRLALGAANVALISIVL